MSINLVSTGVILILYVTIAIGGGFMLRVVNGSEPATPLQHAYYRAGHAHAGVILLLGLVVRLIMSDPRVADWGRTAADGILYAAILMPAGFFLSVLGRGSERPNALRWLIVAGGLLLSLSVTISGIALITAGLR